MNPFRALNLLGSLREQNLIIRGKTVNFISAPHLDFPIRLFSKQIRAQTQLMAVLTPSDGFETGWNFRNAVNGRQGKSVFRGFIGADLLFRFNPKIPGLRLYCEKETAVFNSIRNQCGNQKFNFKEFSKSSSSHQNRYG
jgi:hypothetical protein